MSITECSFTRYEMGADGQVYEAGHVEKTSVTEEVINSKPLGAPSAADEFADAEGLGRASVGADTSIEAARSLRLLTGVTRVLRVGGYAIGLLAFGLDLVEGGQAALAGDTRAAIGDFASGFTTLGLLIAAELVLSLIGDGVTFVAAALGLAVASLIAPDLAKFISEWVYGWFTGNTSNIESPLDMVYAPDIYVTNATGGPVRVQLTLSAARASGITPPWDAGAWKVVVEPDERLEVNGLPLRDGHVAPRGRQPGADVEKGHGRPQLSASSAARAASMSALVTSTVGPLCPTSGRATRVPLRRPG